MTCVLQETSEMCKFPVRPVRLQLRVLHQRVRRGRAGPGQPLPEGPGGEGGPRRGGRGEEGRIHEVCSMHTWARWVAEGLGVEPGFRRGEEGGGYSLKSRQKGAKNRSF